MGTNMIVIYVFHPFMATRGPVLVHSAAAIGVFPLCSAVIIKMHI